jgi:hypothetical protein
LNNKNKIRKFRHQKSTPSLPKKHNVSKGNINEEKRRLPITHLFQFSLKAIKKKTRLTKYNGDNMEKNVLNMFRGKIDPYKTISFLAFWKSSNRKLVKEK